MPCAFKRWLDRRPTAQAVVIFPLGVGVTALFRRNEHPLSWVIQGALYTAIAITFLAVQHRRVGRAVGTDPSGTADLSRKIRHREVPSDPGEQVAVTPWTASAPCSRPLRNQSKRVS
ncbi:hypothetical protein ACFYO2_24165 [Streptomyces sp. NPDC006602]|uniref:hypothetical protein n=1 Tax=Streptomyces sp. NPDC006602 TaxID=3364751 RepID=UPI00369F8A49